MKPELLNSVFHAYDIRGQVPGELNVEFFEQLGKAFVTFLNAKKIVVGYDIRKDSKSFADAFIKGATSQGCNVVLVGEIATEMLYYAVGSDSEFDGGATITASHNPPGWNGCKMVGKGVTALSGDYGLGDIKELILKGEFKEGETVGTVEERDIYPDFKKKILSFLDGVEIKPLKLVVDAGNGIGGKVFDYVFGDLGFEVTKMYFEPDGDFPNHVPNPIEEENVAELREKSKELGAVGIAIDGDADRVMFIDSKGRNPNGVYLGSILAKLFLKDTPGGEIVHDPRVIWAVVKEVEKAGGKTQVIKSGHSFFKDRMKKDQALFGAELSLHFYYRDFYFADSGMVTIASMLKLLLSGLDFEKELDYLYEQYPQTGEVNYVVENIAETIARVEEQFKDGDINKIDGISIEYKDWRFNLRASNTQPLLRLNMEALSKEILVEKFKLVEGIIGGKRDNEPALPELKD